ncbi:hypothetical protein [Azonexus sp.]|jgi:hypothetical protein|uniref:hypothetical protein n=1 Tax=Azonexus sp. TaxID=1872668 RepID=UPI00282E7D54|nr:hypothetical protein [Azonexus sp.]MDR1996013.1 hypothetical protein [Azonexus sp.]
MAAESKFVDKFVEIAQNLITRELKKQPLKVQPHAVLLYQVTVDNNLKVMSEAQVRSPKRGSSAFQTDLCLFEVKSEDVLLPRVVLEFKTTITTHDVLTYSAKAAKHKQIYPYLRYGLVAENERNVPRRFFIHNEAMDFCLSLHGLSDEERASAFCRLLTQELNCSYQLEHAVFGDSKSRLFRTQVVLDNAL